ncbi:hypothetical protein [Pseudomonas paeninsulae]|uniref:hypothetical protein n=1 Tax=Pseudomonas paeninsulae TaxID=3110772 RepID=UPI002D78D9B5|nr:hypothetical protein [Pseudomonas sp. IT1137]
MNTYCIATWTTLAMLLAGPALANHCGPQLAEAQSALNSRDSVEVNVLDAVSALLPTASQACQQEEAQLASAEPGSPMLEPGYISVGQSMLINVSALLSGQ